MNTNQLRSKCNQNMAPSNVMDEALSLFRQLDVNQQREYLSALRDRASKRVPDLAPQEIA